MVSVSPLFPPLNEFRQFSNNCVHSLIRGDQVLVSPIDTTLRKDMLRVWENSLFSQLT